MSSKLSDNQIIIISLEVAKSIKNILSQGEKCLNIFLENILRCILPDDNKCENLIKYLETFGNEINRDFKNKESLKIEFKNIMWNKIFIEDICMNPDDFIKKIEHLSSL